MTVQTLFSRISGIIGLDASTGATEQAHILSWFNEAVEQFLVATKADKRLASLALSAGQSEYTLDTDILSMEKLWIDGASTFDRVLQRMPTADIFAAQLLDVEGVDPQYYSLEGAHLLVLYPAPQTTGDLLKAIYVPRPAAMSVTSDSPSDAEHGNIPSEFHPTLESYVKWKAADYDDDQSSQAGLQYQAEWERGVMKARALLNLKAGVNLGGARWGRRRRFGATPGVDLGY